jgi:SNF2 family DNA or RNA helicase
MAALYGHCIGITYGDTRLLLVHTPCPCPAPTLCRRLKSEVETQMPKKYEHVVMCRLSRRQRALYEDYMASSEARGALASGSFMGIINVLMQLRKVRGLGGLPPTRGVGWHAHKIVGSKIEGSYACR